MWDKGQKRATHPHYQELINIEQGVGLEVGLDAIVQYLYHIAKGSEAAFFLWL